MKLDLSEGFTTRHNWQPHNLCRIVHFCLLSDYWNGPIQISWRRSTSGRSFQIQGFEIRIRDNQLWCSCWTHNYASSWALCSGKFHLSYGKRSSCMRCDTFAGFCDTLGFKSIKKTYKSITSRTSFCV